MFDIIKTYFITTFELLAEMSPYLMLGFFFAGLLYVVFPSDKIAKYFGKSNSLSVINAALLGVPLPLCSCGVIPTGVSFYKNGASKGSSISFLISTPQTGIDSIFVTYSLLGWPFAILRPIIAFITGIVGGIITNITEKADIKGLETTSIVNADEEAQKSKNPIIKMLKYAYVDFLQDIALWLVIGISLAGLIAVLVPDNFFADYIQNDYLSMLILLAIAVPLYVCATASVPIAAVLMMKGVSPGAALIFLMAGPATNIATITVLGKVFGKKTLLTYLLTIIGGALLFGILINEFLPRELFTQFISIGNNHSHHHDSHLIPAWINTIASIILILLISNGIYRKYFRRQPSNISALNNLSETAIKYKILKVTGMNCNHCKMNVEKNLKNIEGISFAEADVQAATVQIKGDNLDLSKVKETIESLGYNYLGEIG